MSLKTLFAATAAAITLAFASIAGDMQKIMVEDAYARVSTANAKSGAAFMQVVNHGEADDRLVDVRSDIAARVELHTHMDQGDGVMKMVHVEEGFAIPAGETRMLKRGGDHVMLMGLKQELKHGDVVALTLVFEQAGEVALEVPVDLERKPGHGGMGHSGHSN
ncbi:copper chaperone PCu(A)C [Roseobacteraceae bacterium NS-SX3]